MAFMRHSYTIIWTDQTYAHEMAAIDVIKTQSKLYCSANDFLMHFNLQAAKAAATLTRETIQLICARSLLISCKRFTQMSARPLPPPSLLNPTRRFSSQNIIRQEKQKSNLLSNTIAVYRISSTITLFSEPCAQKKAANDRPFRIANFANKAAM